MNDRRTAPQRRPRRWPLILLTTFLALVVVLIGAWALFVRSTEGPAPDAFYTPPDPLPTSAPGTILRTEPITEGVPAGAKATKILYLSTGLQGEPIAVSGLVFEPATPAPAGGRPVVAWAHGTTGVADRCAPSLEATTDWVPGLEEFLAAGYVVSATDYPGLGTPGPHPYLVGISEGRAVLDGVRAAQQVTDGAASAPVAFWGHSQGGHAALFAAELAPTYAPELNVVGTAVAAPATDLAGLFSADLEETAGKVLTSMAVVSWSEVYPDAELDEVVEDIAEPVVRQIAERCIITEEQGITLLPDVEALKLAFVKGDPTTTPPWKDLFTQNSAVASKLPAPLFVAQGTEDNIVRPPITATYVDETCAAGTTVALKSYPGLTHFTVRPAAVPDVVAWIADRVAGTPPPSTCP